MSTNPDEDNVLWAGFYNPKKRREQVMEKLKKELEIFRKLDFSRDLADQLPQNNEFRKEPSLDETVDEIGNLIDEVKLYYARYTEGHFTKQYRTFQGGFDKFLQQLDSVNIGNDTSLKDRRRKAIEKVQNTVEFINTKVHQDGKCCETCELYGTMWQ